MSYLITKNRSHVTKKFSSVTKNRSAITKHFSSVTKLFAAVTKQISSVTKILSAITKQFSAPGKRLRNSGSHDIHKVLQTLQVVANPWRGYIVGRRDVELLQIIVHLHREEGRKVKCSVSYFRNVLLYRKHIQCGHPCACYSLSVQPFDKWRWVFPVRRCWLIHDHHEAGKYCNQPSELSDVFV